MPQLHPRKHYNFFSHRNMLRLNIPLIIDEYEITGITVFAESPETDLDPWVTIQISTSGPVILKETGSGNEAKEIKKKVKAGGNDSFHIQSPKVYEYPSGKEGECYAQANILVRKMDKVNGVEVPVDSLSIDLYVRRKLI